MSELPLTVGIAEDSMLLREGLGRILSDAGLNLVACYDNADDLLAYIRNQSLNVAILDIRLPPSHTDKGMRAALHIRAHHPDVAVLVLSQYVEVGLALQLLAGSAERVGYLLKDRISDVQDFTDAVRLLAVRFGRSHHPGWACPCGAIVVGRYWATLRHSPSDSLLAVLELGLVSALALGTLLQRVG